MKNKTSSTQCLKSLSVITLLMALTACNSKFSAGEQRPNSQSQDIAEIKSPTTSLEFLKNIKYAVANNLFFDDGIFFSDRKLWQLLGSQQFYRSYPSTDRGARLSYFPPSIDGAMLDSHKTIADYMTVTITTSTKNEMLINIHNALGMSLTQSDVESVFGYDWKYARPHFDEPSCPRIAGINCPKPIHYREAEYTLDASSLRKAIATVTYEPTGKVVGIIINIKENNP